MSEHNPVVVMVSNRPAMLANFLVSFTERYPGLAIAIHSQGEKSVFDEVLAHAQLRSNLHVAYYMHSEESLGCHASRVLLLQALEGMGFDTYINVDDDVQLIEQTNWAPAIAKAHEPGVGFVLTNWIKHRNGLERAISIMTDEFIAQAMVYNGGGMAYSEDVAKLIRMLPAVPARYDDIWPLTAYLYGYKNYRFRGSLAIHGIMAKGGMTGYMRREPRPLLCTKWITYRYLPGQPVGSDYSIPMDSDLKQSAKDEHKRARAERGWS